MWGKDGMWDCGVNIKVIMLTPHKIEHTTSLYVFTQNSTENSASEILIMLTTCWSTQAKNKMLLHVG